MANGELPAIPPGGLLPPRPAPRGPRPPAVGAGRDRDREEPRLAPAGPAASAVPALRPRIAELISALPIVSLEQPSPGRPELTPSPVPRVSLVPPTGQIDRSLLPLPPAAEDLRRLPTVAPRRQDAPTVAGQMGLPAPRVYPARAFLPRPVGARARTVPPSARLRRGWLRDVRSSKREIVLGLAIGLALSVLVGRVGQAYLEQRGAATFAARAPRAASALGVVVEDLRPAVVAAPAPLPPAQLVPASATLVGAEPAAVPARANSGAALPPEASKEETVVPTLRAPHQRKASGSARGTPRERAAEVGAAWHENPEAPASRGNGSEDREPRGTAPLSPAQSAGLGLELPL